MEKHGVTFRDYAVGIANQAGGMSVDEVCKVLGIETPIWDEVCEFYENEMKAMDDEGEDMQFYIGTFSNPKQGKFASKGNDTAGTIEETLQIHPTWDDFIKIEQHITIGAQKGISVDTDKEYGISIQQYTQLGMHWMNYMKEDIFNRMEEQASLTEKWKLHFEDLYKNSGADLSEDLNF